MGGNENAQGAAQSAKCILNPPSSPSTPPPCSRSWVPLPLSTKSQPPGFPCPPLAPGTQASLLLLKHTDSSHLQTSALALRSAWNIFPQECRAPSLVSFRFLLGTASQKEAPADQLSKMAAPNTPYPPSPLSFSFEHLKLVDVKQTCSCPSPAPTMQRA